MLTLAPIAAVALLFLCAGRAAAQSILPQPQRTIVTAERYQLPAAVTILAAGSAARLVPAAREILRRHATGASLELRTGANDTSLGSEGYRLTVTASGIRIDANAPAGLFYGLQTLDQLLPAPGAPAVLDGVRIEDWPSYSWRGTIST